MLAELETQMLAEMMLTGSEKGITLNQETTARSQKLLKHMLSGGLVTMDAVRGNYGALLPNLRKDSRIKTL